MRTGVQAWVPVLALILLFGLGLQRLIVLEPLSPEAMVNPELQRKLGEMLGRGRVQGYVGLLQQYQRDDVLSLQALSIDGEILAQWPAPLTRQNWGAFAPLLEDLRQMSLRTLTSRHEVVLRHDGEPVGSLVQQGVRGIYGMRPARLFYAGVTVFAAWGLLLALGQLRVPRKVAVPQVLPPPQAPRAERMTARFGDALDHAAVGLLLLNGEQRVRYLNHAAAEFVGRSRSEALEQSVFSVLRLEPGSGPELRLAADAPLVQTLNAKLRDATGGHQRLELTALRLRESKGQPAGMLIWMRSLEEELSTEASLRWEARLAQITLDSLSDGLAVTDKFGRIKRVNQCLNRLFSYAEGELEGVAISKLLPVPFLNEPSIKLSDYIGQRTEGRPRVVGWRKNATTFPVELKVTELDSEEHAYLLLINDCGDRLRQDNLSMRLGRLLDYAAEEIYIFDAHSLYITEANRQARDNLGFSLDQLSRMTPLHLAPRLERQAFERDLSALRNGEQRQVVLRTEHRRADGSVYPVSLRLSYSGEEEPPVFMALAQDVTEQRAAEQQLEFLAHHDALTGAPNRAALSAHLQHLLGLSPEQGEVVVFFLDLDQFKAINDTYSHSTGDQVLLEFTTRLRACLPEGYYMARLSGDEFVVVGQCDDRGRLHAQAERILEGMRPPMHFPGISLQLSVSIGIAIAQPGESVKDLVHRADKAMYLAKSQGSGYHVGGGEAEIRRSG